MPKLKIAPRLELTGRYLRVQGRLNSYKIHIGSGNVHSAFVIDPRDPDEVRRVLAASDDIHRLALEMGGTVTGEHGVGFVRPQYMAREHGPALAAMQAIKRALDPQGIMNPGKLLPMDETDRRIDG